MNRGLFRAVATSLLAVCGVAVSAQAMSGTYTVDSSLPASATNFTDLGTAMQAVKINGMSGAVTLEVYEGTGPYTSTADYTLTGPVTGSSATSVLTIKAATGEQPVISGSAANNGAGYIGTLAFSQMSYVTVEGLHITGGAAFGLGTYNTVVITDVTFRRNTVYNCPGAGIWGYCNSTANPQNNVVIENNFLYNCEVGGTGSSNGYATGCITFRRPNTGCAIRHNTIVRNSGTAHGAIGLNAGSAFQISECSYNVVYVSVSGVPCWKTDAGQESATTTQGNCYYFTNGATFHSSATYPTFASWQAAGKDTNGLNADPLLTNTTLSSEDLHLLPTSPCIDAAVGSTLNEDIDGDIRPSGAANDIGADEAGDPPDMYVAYNATAITDGSSVNVGDARTQVGDIFTFEIGNVGLGDLYLTGTPVVELIQGTNNAGATGVQTQPGLLIIPQSGTTTFVINVEPTAVGPWDLVISIVNNDKSKTPYDFTVSGMGILPNDAAKAAPAAGSSFAGPVNGPFEMSANPGAALASAAIELTDVDLDNIVVASITAITTVPTGVTPPSIPGAAHPVVLSWTGNLDSTNTPGAYTWEIEFADTVNLTPVTIQVTIVINDLAPTHVLLNAVQGDGSSGNPYLANYFGGATGASAVDLATVTDPNTAQLLTLSAVVQVSGPDAGTGFQFSLSAGVLRIAPAGTLVDADAGNQAFTVVVSDGLHSVLIRVDAFVFGSSGKMYFLNSPTLPFATENVVYGPENLLVEGGTAPYTFTEISGSLPAGITMSAAGVISGTSAVIGTSTVTVRVIDANNDTLTGTFTLTVRPPAGKGGTGSTSTSSGSDGCSSSEGGSTFLWALAALACIAGLRMARRRA